MPISAGNKSRLEHKILEKNWNKDLQKWFIIYLTGSLGLLSVTPHDFMKRPVFFCDFWNDVNGTHDHLVQVSVFQQADSVYDPILETSPDSTK